MDYLIVIVMVLVLSTLGCSEHVQAEIDAGPLSRISLPSGYLVTSRTERQDPYMVMVEMEGPNGRSFSIYVEKEDEGGIEGYLRAIDADLDQDRAHGQCEWKWAPPTSFGEEGSFVATMVADQHQIMLLADAEGWSSATLDEPFRAVENALVSRLVNCFQVSQLEQNAAG